jgi:membrane protein implicated in regulation of membrane protease activity
MSESFFSKPEIIWFIIGLVLLLLELVMPGFVIFFFGIGAWVTALVCLFAEPNINIQVVIFALSSVLTLILFRRMIKNKFLYNKDDKSEAVEDEFTGKEAVAVSDFSPGNPGKVEFKGTSWDAESVSEIKKGQRVIVKEKKSIKLIVEPKK